jgi:hypothetical protein
MTAAPDDWQRMGQEATLQGATLTWKNYQALTAEWEHEHCAFCFRKFLDPAYSDAHRQVLKDQPDKHADAGYTTVGSDSVKAGAEWICQQCFEDFKDEFRWSVAKTDPSSWPYEGPEPSPRPTSADAKARTEQIVPRPE